MIPTREFLNNLCNASLFKNIYIPIDYDSLANKYNTTKNHIRNKFSRLEKQGLVVSMYGRSFYYITDKGRRKVLDTKVKYMQCKDINTWAVLNIIYSKHYKDNLMSLFDYIKFVFHAPEKVVDKKLTKILRSGLIYYSGEDWELTDKGIEMYGKS